MLHPALCDAAQNHDLFLNQGQEPGTMRRDIDNFFFHTMLEDGSADQKSIFS